ncbi:MAG: hypothetical protein HQK59_02910 [Deltaproteobacteria bacterium]|nr:hypothetical protein [Deltaproteobacteria bacterium]
MMPLVGGGGAVVLGLIGLVIWWGPFLDILKGAIPIALLLGGALATYLGLDEIKDKFRKDDADSAGYESAEELKKYKEEVDQLKDEIKAIKEAKA